MAETMLGRWDRWYAGLDVPAPYGDEITYQRGAVWLAGLSMEDWGCGKGWMRRYVEPGLYRGIDGSSSPFADHIADLCTYRSTTAGVFLRHVLEHNPDWPCVLDNALASATERVFIAIFTPLVDETRQLAYAADIGVPDIAFALSDITDRIEAAGFSWVAETIPTNTQYGAETILECAR